VANALLVFNSNPYFEGAQEAKITELAQWVKEADEVISF
jgi:sulfur relay (sulfurtransferase) complex TusBCD TusD component (DsrE family)